MDIIMPKMGESISEGTILKWHKKKGDAVKRDEIIFEISTDKVDTEIPSPADGVLSEIHYNEGDTVEVGTVVAVLDSSVQVKDGVIQNIEEIISLPAAEAKITEPEIVKSSISNEEKIKGEIPVTFKSVAKNDGASEIIQITMPKMGESVMEGTIIKWHKKVGEQVKKDEIIFEISTDKVDTEVPAPAAGTLAEILVGEQETVEVGTVVAKLAKSVVLSEAKEIKGKVESLPKAVEHAILTGEENKTESLKESSKFLSPLVLNILRIENIAYDELDNINGTGLNGRVTKKDILVYIEDKKNQESAKVEQKASKSLDENLQEINYKTVATPSQSSAKVRTLYSSNEIERIPMDNVRQKIMQHMINSRDTSVHVSAMLEADVTRIYNFLKNNRDDIQRKEGVKLTYMPFIAHACIKALKEFPFVNAALDGNTIIKKKYINLGIAVAVDPAGLIVPNIKNADGKNIFGLARSMNDLAERAKTKKLVPDDITNGTFTITNYGVFGTIFGTPIINQPEVAILGVGSVVKKPVVIEIEGTDTIVIKPIMALTLTHDHRLVDGMLGGRFLKSIKDTLENFNVNSI
jgi:2-oxoglutarate dehydrogenase E2 component (dihydrolipoamide succinyltransferase)